MLSFIARRLGLLIPTFFGVTLLTFALIRLIPGDPVEVMMGERRVDPEMHAQAMERLGLNKPLYAQYLDYIGQLASGNLGESLRSRESVWGEFLTLFPATVELALAALLFAGTLGIAVSTVGIAPVEAVRRFTFGLSELNGGFSMLTVMIGMFAVAEVIKLAETGRHAARSKVGSVSMKHIKGFGFSLREFRQELPKTNVGKILRRELRDAPPA